MKYSHYIFGSVLHALYFELWVLTRINSKCQTLMVLNVTNSNSDRGERQMVGNGDCGIQSKHCPPRRGPLEAVELAVASWWPIWCCEELTLPSLMADCSKRSSLLPIKIVSPLAVPSHGRLASQWQKKQVPKLFSPSVCWPHLPTVAPPS